MREDESYGSLVRCITLADTHRYFRIDNFSGGIVVNDKDKRRGVSLNLEEMDIFTSSSYVQPSIIFQDDSSLSGFLSAENQKVYGYSNDRSGNVYALTKTTSAPVRTQVYRRTNGGVADPDDWTLLYQSASWAPNEQTPLVTFYDQTGGQWLIYLATTGDIIQYELSTGTESTAQTGTLSSIGTNYPRVPMLNAYGYLYIGNGTHIAKLNGDALPLALNTGAFRLTKGWYPVSMCAVANQVAILCRHTSTTANESRVFYWDTAVTDGNTDEVVIPMGGPQIIVNMAETVFAICAQNGELRVFQITERKAYHTHTLYNIQTETSDMPIIPDRAKFLDGSKLYFPIWKTDKTGMYCFGQLDSESAYALVLDKRFSTTDYSTHQPHAAYTFGANFYASFYDGDSSGLNTAGNKQVECRRESSTARRSSQAVYESILVDGGNPEIMKEWQGFNIVTKPLQDDCSIIIDARTDSLTGTYKIGNSLPLASPLDKTNDQSDADVDGVVADTFWHRDWDSFNGRAIQVRMRMNSDPNSLNGPAVYSIGLFSRDLPMF